MGGGEWQSVVTSSARNSQEKWSFTAHSPRRLRSVGVRLRDVLIRGKHILFTYFHRTSYTSVCTRSSENESPGASCPSRPSGSTQTCTQTQTSPSEGSGRPVAPKIPRTGRKARNQRGLRSFHSRATILMAWLKSADPARPPPSIPTYSSFTTQINGIVKLPKWSQSLKGSTSSDGSHLHQTAHWITDSIPQRAADEISPFPAALPHRPSAFPSATLTSGAKRRDINDSTCTWARVRIKQKDGSSQSPG